MNKRVWHGTWAMALLIGGSFGANGCSEPVKVHSYWGPGLRFSPTSRTYSWAPGAERTTGEGRPRNEHVDGLIRQSVEKHLGQRGYEKASDGKPDFWIDYRVGRDVRGDPNGGTTYPEFVEGAMALYVLNPENQRTIWRGYMEARINESESPAVMVKRLDDAIAQMLAELPARPSAK